jgi:hypothetical protein
MVYNKVGQFLCKIGKAFVLKKLSKRKFNFTALHICGFSLYSVAKFLVPDWGI